MNTRIAKEIGFFLICLLSYSVVFFSFSAFFDQVVNIERYVEAMVVVILVCYLIRFVFIVMKRI